MLRNYTNKALYRDDDIVIHGRTHGTTSTESRRWPGGSAMDLVIESCVGIWGKGRLKSTTGGQLFWKPDPPQEQTA